MNRREFLKSTAAGILVSSFVGIASSARKAMAASVPKEIRLGFQKSGLFVSIKQRGTYEAFFKPRGIDVRWVEFQFGPPMLEALNVGSIDFATVGDAPPIFAQAAAANLYYVAAQPPNGEAVIVPANSPIRTLAELKGRKLGVAKGSSAHATSVAAIQKAGLTWADITPVYLAPADGAAAFTRGAIDAWTVWDPYLASAELQQGARVLAFNKDVHDPHNFYLANKGFAETYPDIVGQIADVLAREAAWANDHRADVARTLQEAQGIDLAIETRVVERATYSISPIDEAIVNAQQVTADRFHDLGLIPKRIAVRDIVWKWTPKV
ncbi:aliphatic sulfonate ABC transporter substrate-binding protein [Telmatospirillum siberiense]|uniref:Putative aliphatic sulfonates-binding protein n=1 Tax=Telmatospirillum siberiense TaxID=382514 RepID=A0A2N3PP19_9PROT|nr:aliphatic sulfonate ABC transporter substrate-binding protein [Telmatospirillum siberiense]PKU22142.1 sulfonate ABC transporter substrate-binding protein [Telmatospirillum siberiense]